MTLPDFEGNVLFVNAHPDDESMAHCAAISTLTARNPEKVFVLTATCGEASTKGKEIAAGRGRLQELEKAYDALGVKPGPKHRIYPNLQDSQLHAQENISKLTKTLADYIKSNEIKAVITPGWEGFDGHSDHIAVHLACIIAAGQSSNTRILGLNAAGRGSIKLPVDQALKKDCMSHHKSQLPQNFDDLLDASPVYKRLMEKETYDYCDSPDDMNEAKRLAGSLGQHIPK